MQQLQQEEENAISDEKPAKINPTPERILVNRDWDDDEQKLWSLKVANPKPSRQQETMARDKIHSKTTSTTPQLKDPTTDWIYAYYYHTGVTPNIEMTRPHPMFDRAPTNGLRKSLPRSAFSQDDLPLEQDFDADVVPHRPQPQDTTTPPALEDRQHWMPDRLCKHCYACDTPFTVFRRRHHCRICGQVFCNNCSGFFVPSQPNPVTTNKTILRACKMCYEQVTERQQLLEEEEDIRKRRKSQEITTTTPAIISSPSQPKPTATNVSPTLQEQLDRGDSSVLHSLSKRRTESVFARKSLQFQEEALERDEKEQATKILRSLSQSEKEEIQQETRDLVKSPDRAFHKRLVRMTSSGSLTALDRSKAVEEGNWHLGMTVATHLEQLGKALLATDAPLLVPQLSQRSKVPQKLFELWVSKLMTLVTRCCATVEPSVKKGDLLDIRPYVKIKGKSGRKKRKSGAALHQ